MSTLEGTGERLQEACQEVNCGIKLAASWSPLEAHQMPGRKSFPTLSSDVFRKGEQHFLSDTLIKSLINFYFDFYFDFYFKTLL